MEGTPSEGVTAKLLVVMKFSTEAIVAAAVALVFAVLTLAAVAREQGEPGNSSRNRPAVINQVAALSFDRASSLPSLDGTAEKSAARSILTFQKITPVG